MEEKKRPKGKKGKGLYVAIYASLGGLLVLAAAIGYYNFLTPAPTADVAVYDNAFVMGEEDIPVAGGNINWPDLVQVTPTPAPMPSPTPTPAPATTRQTEPANQGQAYPLEPEQAELQEDDEVETAYEPDFEHEIFMPDEILGEAAAPSFAAFTADDSMHWPILGEVVMEFAQDRLVYDITLDQWRTNDNIAIAAMRGDTVRAAAEGIVIEINNSRELGPTVVIDHGNGWLTTYSQLTEDILVNMGDVVTRGQIIGNVGSPSIFSSLLGYHLNFSVRNDEGLIDPHAILNSN